MFTGRTGWLLLFSVSLTACGGSSSNGQADGEEQRVQTASSDSNEGVSGPRYYLETMPSPCALMTEAVAQDLLKVREVVANPANSGPESSSPRCAYRDGEQLHGEPGMSYSTVDPGPGAQRFVAQRDDGLTMLVMTGLGTQGGSFEPNQVKAEAAFSVSLKDPARTAEELLVAVRNLATAYQSNLINAAKPV